jgi:hypothetical protein
MSKRNHRYYGPTESEKMASSLSEVLTDLGVVFRKIDEMKEGIEALASGYIMASGYDNSLYDINARIRDMEERVNKRIYIQAEQAEIL